MKRTRRKFTSEFKARVALDAIRERESLADLATKYDLHPNQISKWKQEFMEKSSKVFDSSGPESPDEKQPEVEKLYAAIGELKVENDFLKKSLNKGLQSKKEWGF